MKNFGILAVIFLILIIFNGSSIGINHAFSYFGFIIKIAVILFNGLINIVSEVIETIV